MKNLLNIILLSILIILFILLIVLYINYIKDSFSNNEIVVPSVIIAGCARDCSKYLPKVLNKIKELSTNKKVYFIFYENDSKDNTLELLQNFIKDKTGIVITEKLNIKRRTSRIAHCRNKILEHIMNNNLDKKYEYFINMDLDNVNVNLNVSSVNKCLNESNKWDIASVNQTNYYYDLWALRANHKNNNCWNWDICFKTLDKWFPNIKELKNKKNIKTNLQYIPVLSAFGGLTIYKTFLLKNSWYSGEDKKNLKVDDCEHVNFHDSILKNYPNIRFFIIPYMTND